MRPGSLLRLHCSKRSIRCVSPGLSLPGGGRFTDSSRAALLESGRRVIALVRTQSLGTGVSQRAITAQIYFNHLRTLIRWMDREGFARFDALDANAVADFKREIAARISHGGKVITPTTLALHLSIQLPEPLPRAYWHMD